jgi:hypothetical protein
MDLQQLINEATPGSIWMRTDGSRARVIAITNLSLPAESQQKYVPVVVYVGPSGKVFSRPLKDFAGYFPTWLGHDQGAENAIAALTTPLNAPKPAPVAASDDDAIDMSLDEPVAAQAPRAKPVVQVREKTEAKLATVAHTGNYNDLTNRPPAPPDVMRSAFQIGNDATRKTPIVDADQLSRALRVYSQVPDEHLGLVVHKLSFELSPKLTIDHLKEVFAPDDWVNTVDVFRIGTPVSDETVGVDAYIGVYPEFTRSVLYGTVYVGVDMVPAPKLESHIHEQVPQAKESAPQEEVPSQEVPANDAVEIAVPNDNAAQEPVPDAVSQDQTQAQDAEATSQEDAPADVAQGTPSESAVAEPALVPAEIGENASAEEGAGGNGETLPTPDPVKKPRKKRVKKEPPKPVATDDDDLDVESLS